MENEKKIHFDSMYSMFQCEWWSFYLSKFDKYWSDTNTHIHAKVNECMCLQYWKLTTYE